MPGRPFFVRVVALLGLSAAVSCSPTYGKLYVSHPQVNTRERLVGERYGEVEWLRGELKNTETIVTTFQGYRDFAEVTGFTNELRAGFNPSQASLAKVDEEIEIAKRQTDLIRRETELELAKKELEKAKTGNGTAPAAGTPSAATPTATLPASPTPMTKEGMLPLPSRDNPVESKAKIDVRSLRRIKQAERNDINSDIRATMLDDAHDIQGLALYQLSLHTSLVPGERSESFAQIFLSVNPYSEGEERELQLVGLYYNWASALRERILREISRLQIEFDNAVHKPSTGKTAFTQVDLEQLTQFAESTYPGLTLHMDGQNKTSQKLLEQANTAAATLKSGKWRDQVSNSKELVAKFLDFISRYRLFVLHTRAGVEAIKQFDRRLRDLEAEVRTFNKKESEEKVPESFGKFVEEASAAVKEILAAIGNLSSFVHADATKMPKATEASQAANKAQTNALKTDDLKMADLNLSKEEQAILRKVIGWAAWTRYRGEFSKIIHVTEPVFSDDTGKIKEDAGVLIQPVLPIVLDDPELKDRFPKELHVPMDLNIGSQGLPVFINRLERIEKRVHALTVDPKEYAQNVSEATARESALNLMLALSAVIPTAGVTAENKTQFVRHTQEVLHAIDRRPLLVGFGQGQREFGWVLGPKFMIDDSDAVYRHMPVRHECSASIVVPAWWTLAKLTGRYIWISSTGSSVRDQGGSLWENKETGNSITIELPMEPDAHDKITQALTAHSIAGEAYWASTRPKPRITYPMKGVGKITVLKAGAPNTLLVLGKDLWRSPEIYVGSQRADRVTITSDMGGLLAYFDKLKYPNDVGDGKGPISQTLRVITSFGPAEQFDSVAILPEDAPKKPPPSASLNLSKVVFSPNKVAAAEYGISLTIKKEDKKLSFDGADELMTAAAKGEVMLLLTDARGEKVEIPLTVTDHGDQQVDFLCTAATLSTSAVYSKLFDANKGLQKGVASTVEITYKLSNGKSVTVRAVDEKDASKAGTLTFIQAPPPAPYAPKETITFKKTAPKVETEAFKLLIANGPSDDTYGSYKGLQEAVEKTGTIEVTFTDKAGKGKAVSFSKVPIEAQTALLQITIPAAELVKQAETLLGFDQPVYFAVKYATDKIMKGGTKDDPSKDGIVTFKQEESK